MHFIRDAISDARLKYKISNNVHGAVHFFRRVQYNHNPATRSSLSASTAQETTEEDSIADSVQSNSGKNYPATCLALAEEHSKLVLQNVCEHLSFSHNDSAYATLLLLEYMVSSGSRAFHVSVARNSGVKEKLVMLASRRAESPGQRRVQHLARLTLLDYRRVFADDEDLRPLAVLADQFERKTHKNLMRCLNVRQTHVRFRDPEEGDFIALSSRELDPKGEDGQSEEQDGDSSEVKPPPIKRNYPPWTCRVCSHVNPPAALHCRSCSSARRGSSPPISPPAGRRHDGMFGVGSADVDEGAPPPVEAGDEGQQSPNTHLSGSSSLGEVQPTGSAKMEKCMSGSVDSSRAVVSELSSSAEQHASIISSTSTVKMELSHGSIAARGLEAERNEVPAFTEVEEAQTTSQRANSDHTHSLAMETQDT